MRLKTLFKIGAAAAIAGGAAVFALTMPPSLDSIRLPAPYSANLANGETMFNIGGCASCHATPKQENYKLLGGGLKMHTPFGTFNVPNISSDPKAGIGAWTEPEFVRAMQKGIGRHGEHLYPAFPYTSYQRMPVNDVRDLFAFMKTLPAVATPSTPHQMSFPFNIRRGLGLWQTAFLDGRRFEPDPTKSARLNRGAYLVNGPGHCAECHSGRNAAGAIDEARRWSGGADPEGRGWIPNITPHADGLAEWSDKDIAYMLESGFTPAYDAVGSTMADVVKNTARLTAEDRDAMATYLKSLPAKPGKSPRAKKAAEKDAPPAGDGKK